MGAMKGYSVLMPPLPIQLLTRDRVMGCRESSCGVYRVADADKCQSCPLKILLSETWLLRPMQHGPWQDGKRRIKSYYCP